MTSNSEWAVIFAAIEEERKARIRLATDVRRLAICFRELHRAELDDDGTIQAIIESLGGAS